MQHNNTSFSSKICLLALILLSSLQVNAQHSVARQWNEVNLQAIRGDFARPTMHARNLFHASILMYDSWAAYEYGATPFFLGDSLGDYACSFNGVNTPADKVAAQEEALSFAMYRILSHRYDGSPQETTTFALMDALMTNLGYDPDSTSVNYETQGPYALGNYMAQELIAAGMMDGSNEFFNYSNTIYQPVNEDVFTPDPGNPNISDYNRWQPVSVTLFIDQAGNPFPYTPPFLSPEWGRVVPFAMDESDRTTFSRTEGDYDVYMDPGPPPYMDVDSGNLQTEEYNWGFSMVATWASHLDPADSVMWDISPGAQGNFEIDSFPSSYAEYDQFYNYLDGGEASQGRGINPSTGLAYEPQIVPRGDFTRVLAEFWADGPDSETPPGHWFAIYNEVSDHTLFNRKWRGQGADLSDLEYDIKAYFSLGGAMHDAAVAAWSVKGWYDYLRPVSAIRAMADLGQSTDTSLSNYHVGGLPLVPGYIEVVEAGDTLQGDTLQNIGKIKLYSWRGPDYIEDEETDVAGVDWILAENWWPYQRPTFVTPPFAGYVSGHSTFSRAAAEVMTLMTGDEYFPGGMGEFLCPKDEFLVFEDGPSVDVTLQWATYRDASDQTSLSRIWGGIHPPCDDIPGREMGEVIGVKALDFAETYFENTQDCSAFDTPPTQLSKSFNPVNGVYDRVQLKWYKDSLQTKYSVADAAACELKFWPVKDLLTGSAINGDTSLIPMSKIQKPGQELFKWPVKFNRDDVDPSTRYKWQVRCACDAGNGPVSPWSGVKIFNTPAFEMNSGIVQNQLFWGQEKQLDISMSNVQVFPNPSNGQKLTVKLSLDIDEKAEIQLRLLDLTGKQFLEQNVLVHTGLNFIPLAIGQKLSSGIYFLESSTLGGAIRTKIVVE